MTWVTKRLSSYELSRAYNRRSELSARIYLTEYYFSVLPQPGEQARRLGYVARNPTTVSANPTDVLSNIENWRTSIQKLNELTNWIPMKEDIKTAFESLIAPVVEHVSGFELNRELIKRKAYASITTTDADVYKYITSIQEEILKLPRSTQWKKEADSQEQQQKYQEEAYDAYSQEQDDVEEADEEFDVDKWHEEMYGPYDDETHQEDWDGDDAYQDQEQAGYDDDGTYEQEGYEAWEQQKATTTKPGNKKKATMMKPMMNKKATTTKPRNKKKAATMKPMMNKKATIIKPMIKKEIGMAMTT